MSEELEFHPLANEYPLMEEADLERLVQSMRDFGFDDSQKGVLLDGKILDGRNRYIAARKAGVEPKFRTVSLTPDEAAEYVRILNEERRHLEREWLAWRRKTRAESRKVRIQRACELRATGMTAKAVSDALGIGERTVLHDLRAARADGVECDPDFVKGADGKSYKFNPNEKRRSAAPRPRHQDSVSKVSRTPAGQIAIEISGAGFTLSESDARAFHKTLGLILGI